MNAIYELDELDRTGVVLQLTPAERRALSRLEGKLRVDWRPDGTARVYPRGHVGIATLSPETTIRVTTKVPVANVLALAGLAYHTLPVPPSLGDALIEPVSDVVDWLAVLLIAETEALLAYGLRQDYVVVQEELPYVRGRLRFEAMAISANRALAACEFADFLPDIAENRILRAGLELLATQRLLPGLRVRVEQLLVGFQRVAFIRPARGQLPPFQITRLNRHYQPAPRAVPPPLRPVGREPRRGIPRGSRLLLPDGDRVPGSRDNAPAQANTDGASPARACAPACLRHPGAPPHVRRRHRDRIASPTRARHQVRGARDPQPIRRVVVSQHITSTRLSSTG